MRLLIIDDEKITREGIMNGIDWQNLGISAVALADDGVHGCDIAMSFHPDIILSDIRMPRMNGIQMAEKLQNANPFLSVIFMSGFSEKEYLKAAIRLKAVSYVEKPIDVEEIKEAVREACHRVAASKKAASSNALSLSHSRARLASALTSPSGAKEAIKGGENTEFDFPLDDKTSFFTLFIQLYHNAHLPEELNNIASFVSALLANQHLHEIHSTRQESLIFFHIWGFSDYDDCHKKRLGDLIIYEFERQSLHYHLVFGKNVKGASQIHDSYYSAVIELQHSFFTRENTCCIYQNTTSRSGIFLELNDLGAAEKLSDLLLKKDASAVRQLLSDTLNALLKWHNSLPNQIREFYYKLLSAVEEAYHILHISNNREEHPGSLWETVTNCPSIYALHELLEEKVRLFFLQAEDNAESNSSIYLIKKFIADHYMEETLSIKVISEHVFLSTSYLCTLFKNETGQTLNQYLTDFRIEKAKKLLRDPRNRIGDISSQVGYSDGNYFGKIFKKTVGMSPSEYREQETP